MSNTWVDHPLAQLTLVRFREFWREPEAIFWVFIFPVLLAAGLGLAFRNRPPDVIGIAAVTPELARSLRQEKLLDVEQLSAAAAEEALRTGKVALFAAPSPGGAVVYRYDNTNPEGRTARMLADGAVQRAAGRADPVPASDRLMREPGSRYIDFLIPGLLGLNLMSSAIWGMGFAIVDARRKKLMKRLIATPMPRHYYLASFVLARLLLLVVEVGVLLGFGAWVFQVPVRGSLLDLAVLCVLGSLAFSALGLLIASRAQTIEAVSGRAAARDPGAAADGGDRRAAGPHAARRRPGASGSAIGRAGGLAAGVVHAGAETVPLAIGGRRSGSLLGIQLQI